jgi:hypothetical protein
MRLVNVCVHEYVLRVCDDVCLSVLRLRACTCVYVRAYVRLREVCVRYAVCDAECAMMCVRARCGAVDDPERCLGAATARDNLCGAWMP